MVGSSSPKACAAIIADSDAFVPMSAEGLNKSTENGENSRSNEKIVIIGNGTAGYHAAIAVRKESSTCSIEIIAGEKHLTYYRPQLSNLLSREIPDKKFYLSPEQWYRDNNIKLALNTFVEKIDSHIKELYLQNGSTVKYDKLILATGSSNFMPPIPGINKDGVFTLKNLDDAVAIKTYLNPASEVIVIGGGLLGFEAAWEMRKRGLKVTVVEFFPRLLPRQLDAEGAELFKSIADKSGIHIILGNSVEEILGEAKATGVKLNSGKTVPGDLVLFSVGIRANKALAEHSGIQVNHGILVNERLETSLKDVYACGDCVEFKGKTYGTWPAATLMGKIAGINALGGNEEFSDFTSSTFFNAMNTQLFSAGEIEAPQGNHGTDGADGTLKELSYKDPDSSIYKKLFFRCNRLVGGILLGDTKKSVKLSKSIEEHKSLEEVMKDSIL